MPRAAGQPTASFELPTLTAADLRPRPISGHLLRSRRSSGDRWVAHWRDAAGRQHKRVLGRVWSGRGRPAEGYLTKQGAQQLLDEVLVEARKAGPRTARRSHDVTFADAAAEWLRYVEHDRKRRPTTLRDYRRMVNKELVPLFGHLPLRAMTSELIDSYRAHLVAEGNLSARTINKYLLALHAIFKRAQRHYGLTTNPVAGVERQPVRRSTEFRVLSPEEVEALCRAAREGRHRTPLKHEVGPEWEAVQGAQDAQDAVIYTVAAYAGLRLGELRALRWRDVDFARRLFHVRRAFTLGNEDVPKSGHARAVPMIDQVARALDELSRRNQWTNDDDLVFVSPSGEYLEDSALRRRFYEALKAAKIKHLRFHDLRHSFGTLAVQVFPLSDVKAYMGHADIATTMIYVHHVPQHDAAAKLSAAVAQTTEVGGLGVDPARVQGEAGEEDDQTA
jgi:integrase